MVLGLSAIIACILLMRCFNAAFYPILHSEDGTEMVAYYLTNPHPSEIFRFYQGYISLIPNTIGFLVTSLAPLYLIPYVFVAISIFFSTLALSIFSLKRFRFIMADDKSRMLVCLLLALIPLGNYALITTLAFSLNSIYIISLLLILAPGPISKKAWAAQFIFLVLAVFSHPLSILFIPICVMLFLARPSKPDRILNASMIVIAILYVLFGTVSRTMSYGIGIDTILTTFKYIAHRVVFEPIFGNHLRMILYDADQSLIITISAWIIVAGLCLFTLFFSKTERFSIKKHLPMLGCLLFIIFRDYAPF